MYKRNKIKISKNVNSAKKLIFKIVETSINFKSGKYHKKSQMTSKAFKRAKNVKTSNTSNKQKRKKHK